MPAGKARADHVLPTCSGTPVEHTGCAIPLIPTDMNQPGYVHFNQVNNQRSKDQLAWIAQYISANEWAELATAVNASLMKHHHCNNTLAMAPFYLTLGHCFCPMVYVACLMSERVHQDIEAIPIAQTLKDRGITLSWDIKTKLDPGGLWVTTSASTPPAAPPQQPMMTTIPDGVAPGGQFQLQTPTGAMMTVTCPPGSGPGQQIQVMVPAVRATPQVMVR